MNFFGVGALELLLLAVLAFILFGPNRLVESARTLSKTVTEVRRQAQEAQEALANSLREPKGVVEEVARAVGKIDVGDDEAAASPKDPRAAFLFPRAAVHPDDTTPIGKGH
jgi:sec-independent protein translocase protein TatB